MFVQVIQGRVADPSELRAQMDRWTAELAPGSEGWLGSTGGVTRDGDFIAFVCFESPEAAERNSHRPEQHQWWMETAKLFEGDVTFRDCREAMPWLRGVVPEAGFVQIMQGKVHDAKRMQELGDQFARLSPRERPDILGGVVAMHGDGNFTQAVYFTSEKDARAGERKEMSEEARQLMEQENEVTSEVSFFDLTEPWLDMPQR